MLEAYLLTPRGAVRLYSAREVWDAVVNISPYCVVDVEQGGTRMIVAMDGEGTVSRMAEAV